MKRNNKPVFYDRVIIHRVKQYLEENVHQTYLDVGLMTRQLQNRYPEYSRRKVSPFRLLVEQAYRIVSQSYGLDNASSDDLNSNSDIEVMDEKPNHPPNNQMNDMLVNLYSKSKPTSSATITTTTAAPLPQSGSIPNENIPIAISSDESDDDDEQPRLKNGTANKAIIEQKHSGNNGNNSGDKEAKQSYSNSFNNNPEGNSHKTIDNGNFKRLSSDTSNDEKLLVKKRRVSLESSSQTNKTNKKETTTSNATGTGSVNPPPRASTPTNIPSLSSYLSSKHIKRPKKEVALKYSTSRFADIGGMENIIQDLCEILMCFKYPSLYHLVGLNPPRGILLHGPPGCGKTLFANCIAGQLGVRIIDMTATELIGGISGESEERIRDVFEQAATNAPCVLFIDEIDAIASNRAHSQKDMERRMATQLISSLDGLQKHENSDGVFVVGATTRPDVLDPALRRVGRFDHEIAIGIPDRKSRKEILKIICNKLVVNENFDFDKIAELTPGYVGADLFALCSRAASVMVQRKCLEHYRLKHENLQIVDLLDDIDEVMPNTKTVDNNPSVKNVIEEDRISIDSQNSNSNKSELLKCSLVSDEIENDSSSNLEMEDSAILNILNDTIHKISIIEETLESEIEKQIKEKNEYMRGTKAVFPQLNTLHSQEAREEDTSKNIYMEENETNEVCPTKANVSPVTTSTITPENLSNTIASATRTEVSSTTPSTSATSIASAIATTSVTPVTPPPPIISGTSAAPAEATDDEPITAAPTPITSEKITISSLLVPKLAKQPERSIKDPSVMDLMNWMDLSTMSDIKSDLVITIDDFTNAIKLVQPSSKREGFITVPDVTWDDIGSLKSIREELQLAILAPVKYPEKLAELGLSSPSGVMLCGPPGCGKTLLAKAIANEAGINFISVKGPELMNMYVGESERAVRTCFQRARNSSPCVIFFDEFDSLCAKRSTSSHESGTRIVNQLLTEMDGVEARKGVYLMAATNRPDIIDPAILRPGRLDTILFVGLPDESDREEILLAITKNKTKPALGDDVDIKEIALRSENFTGADLAGLIRQSAMLSLKESLLNSKINVEPLQIKYRHINAAFNSVKPSVGLMERKLYERLRQKYASSSKEPEVFPED